MRQALKSKAGGAARNKVSVVVSKSAPTKGWNTKDSIAAMPEGYATSLINWFPTAGDCVVRGGRSQHATGFTGNVETIAVYNAMDGTHEMFGATSGGIYDATAAGTIGAAVLARTNARHQYVNFGDGTKNWLIMVNGVDKPAYYDGAAWLAVDNATSPALTGLTSTEIIHVNMHKGRLFFIQKDTMSFWYLAAGAAGGALTEFDLSSILSRGGYLSWMATWTRDGGSGPDDLAVFMSSEGQVAIYSGTNPSSAATWSIVGVFDIGRPMGRRGYAEINGDLLVMTDGGIFPLSTSLQSEGRDERASVTDKINGTFSQEARDNFDYFGWETCFYPNETALICNIPQANGNSEQFVMNTNTKAWCKFESWAASCFAVMAGELYFGANGRIDLAWDGHSDDGANIVATGKTSYYYLGSGSGSKRFKMFRPVIMANASYAISTGVNVDFEESQSLSYAAIPSGSEVGIYGSSLYEGCVYGGLFKVNKEWKSPSSNIGFCASGIVGVSSSDSETHWLSSDFLVETGFSL